MIIGIDVKPIPLDIINYASIFICLFIAITYYEYKNYEFKRIK